MGDDDLLSTQLAMLQTARHAVVAAIEQLIDGDRRHAVQLAIVGMSGLVADILSISAGVPEIADLISQQLAESGWSHVRAIEPDVQRPPDRKGSPVKHPRSIKDRRANA